MHVDESAIDFCFCFLFRAQIGKNGSSIIWASKIIHGGAKMSCLHTYFMKRALVLSLGPKIKIYSNLGISSRYYWQEINHKQVYYISFLKFCISK